MYCIYLYTTSKLALYVLCAARDRKTAQSIDIADCLSISVSADDECTRRRSSSHSVETMSVSLDRARASQASTKTSRRARLHEDVKTKFWTPCRLREASLRVLLRRRSMCNLARLRSATVALKFYCVYSSPVPRGRKSSESICSFNSERNVLRSRN